MMDTTDAAVGEQLRLANDTLISTPFYIGTTRRHIGGIALAVQLHLERGTLIGSIAAELPDRPRQTGQPHPLAMLPVTIRGDDRQRIVGGGTLDEAGRCPISGLEPQLRYYLHFGAE